jgi:hypothetical protein
VAPSIFQLLDKLVGDDPRFLFSTRNRNAITTTPTNGWWEAIGKGYRGAYWDILRRYNSQQPVEHHSLAVAAGVTREWIRGNP